MSKEVRNDSNELAEHGAAVCQWASASILDRPPPHPPPTPPRPPSNHFHDERWHGWIICAAPPLLIWFGPSVLFFPPPRRSLTSPLQRGGSARTWAYAYRLIWKGNARPDQHLTSESIFLTLVSASVPPSISPSLLQLLLLWHRDGEIWGWNTDCCTNTKYQNIKSCCFWYC